MRPIPDLQQAHACQILFVGQSEKRRMHAVLEAVQGDSILTVGETDGFLAAGGVLMAMYVYPIGTKPDATADAAIYQLCPAKP